MKKWSFLLIAIVFMLALSACGSSNDSGSAGSTAEPTQAITVEASNWKFDEEVYTVKAGEPLKVTLKNTEGYHGIEIKGVGKVTAGKDEVFTIPAGEYDIICNIMCGTGHDDMVSKLVVQ